MNNISIGRSLSKGPKYPCGNGKEIHPNYLCDGNDDCGNGADEHKECGKNLICLFLQLSKLMSKIVFV